jgi:hypothetical protein
VEERADLLADLVEMQATLAKNRGGDALDTRSLKSRVRITTHRGTEVRDQ